MENLAQEGKEALICALPIAAVLAGYAVSLWNNRFRDPTQLGRRSYIKTGDIAQLAPDDGLRKELMEDDTLKIMTKGFVSDMSQRRNN